jgi:hypothetical protein
MLGDLTVPRPNSFTFMMIDEWSNQTAYDTWDIRRPYMIQKSLNHDCYRYIRWLDIKKKIAYSEMPRIIIAVYNLGLPQDLKLFKQTFKYFHDIARKDHHLARTNDDLAAMDYLTTLHNQLTGDSERTKTLNEYFINDANLLITDLDVLHLVIKQENITNIVVMGQAWESCVKYRPVGLKHVDLTKCNYYMIPNLCYKLNGEPITDQEIIECKETKWARCENHTNPPISTELAVPMYKLVEILK